MISQDCQPCAAPTLAMKTHRHLYPRIYDFGNLYQAFRQAQMGSARDACHSAQHQGRGKRVSSLLRDLRAFVVHVFSYEVVH